MSKDSPFKIYSRGILLLLGVSLLLAIVTPVLNYTLVFPRYVDEIIEHAEQSAIALGSHLGHNLLDTQGQLIPKNIAAYHKGKAESLLTDFDLVKLKIFDSQGVVLYSTSTKDIGTLNSHDYFHNRVAKGEAYTKVVRKDNQSAEGEIITTDVVETYVPIMTDESFRGAFEIYTDITEMRKEQQKTLLFSMLIALPSTAIFLVLMFWVSFVLNRKLCEEAKTKELLTEQKSSLLSEQEKQKEIFSFVENAKRQWETTMDCISELVFLTGPDFSIKRCNNPVADLTGLSYRDILGKNFNEVIPGTGLEGGDTTIGESLEFFHEPSATWFYVSLFPVVETINQDPGFVISFSDITSSKRMTQKLAKVNTELEENRNALQFALDNISVLIVEALEGDTSATRLPFDPGNKCWETISCENTACPCYGKDGMRCWQKAGSFSRGEKHCAQADHLDSCTQCHFFQNVTMDPSAFISEQFNNLMFMLEGKNKELESAYTELKQTQGQLLQQEKMASVGQLAAGVAHEINNPVGFIASNISTLEKYVVRLSDFITFLETNIQAVDDKELQENFTSRKRKLKLDFILEDIKDLVTESLDGCERVKKIVADLKGFSRVDQAEEQYTDINECIDTTLNMVTNELKYKATIHKEYGDLDQINCHPQQLNQVFMNILINAGHALQDKGDITIKTWQDDDFVYTTISDTGSGMSEETVNRIFEPFFTTKDVGKGTGLGLSIVYDIITKNHNGAIDVASKEGEGTTFTIQLPRKTPTESTTT